VFFKGLSKVQIPAMNGSSASRQKFIFRNIKLLVWVTGAKSHARNVRSLRKWITLVR